MTVLQPSCPCFSFLAFYHLEALSFQGKLNILYMIKQIMHDGNQVLITIMELAPFFFFVESGSKTWGCPASRSASPLPAEGSPMARFECKI